MDTLLRQIPQSTSSGRGTDAFDVLASETYICYY